MGLIFLRNKVASGYTPTDSDAAAYISAVETTDGQALEDGVREAIDDFVIGCKADGIWSAIKASCILAGARTLNGALTPLVGTAPTDYNFSSGDYNRKTGLIGDGSTKYIDTNRAGNADPQNNTHLAVYKNDTLVEANPYWIGAGESGVFNIVGRFAVYSNSAIGIGTPNTSQGLHGVSRNNSLNAQVKRPSLSVVTGTRASSTPPTNNHYVHVINNNGSLGNQSASRLSFYSIGEALDLTNLDSRVSTLMTDLGSAIP